MESNADIQLKRRRSRPGAGIMSASAPRAKGMTERLWGTLQPRLPNGLALDKTADMRGADRFLPESGKELDEKLASGPKDLGDSFAPWRKTKEEPGYCLSAQCSRTIDNGSSFPLDCGKCCLADNRRKAIQILPKAKANVFKTPSGKAVAVYDGKCCETKLAANAEKRLSA